MRFFVCLFVCFFPEHLNNRIGSSFLSDGFNGMEITMRLIRLGNEPEMFRD